MPPVVSSLPKPSKKPNNNLPKPHYMKRKKFLKNMGLAAFLFFFLKGLVWLGAFALIAMGC